MKYAAFTDTPSSKFAMHWLLKDCHESIGLLLSIPGETSLENWSTGRLYTDRSSDCRVVKRCLSVGTITHVDFILYFSFRNKLWALLPSSQLKESVADLL